MNFCYYGKNNRIQIINDALKDFEKNNQKDCNNFFHESLKEELLRLINEQTENKKLVRLAKLPIEYCREACVLHDEDFNNGNILIEQIQALNEKCLNSVFLFGNKDNKTLIYFQMKFYTIEDSVSINDKNKLKKIYIKTACKKLLSNIFLNLGIRVKNWHFILILNIDYETKTFNTEIVQICIERSLEYIFFDPVLNEFYDKNQNVIEYLKLNTFTDLDKDKIESDIFNCFQESGVINSYLKKRKRNITLSQTQKSIAIKNAKNFENKYKVSFKDFFNEVKNYYNSIKKIEIILSLEMDIYENNFPSLKGGYGYVFLNKQQNGLIFEGRLNNNEEKYVTFSIENLNNIIPIKICSYINIEEKFIFFIVKLN